MVATSRAGPEPAQNANLLTTLAQNLRRNQTDAEKKLWAALRDRQIAGAKFRRQVPMGPFITDFVCREKRLVIEVDGGQHAEQGAEDDERSEFLARRGYRVLRFWNNEVLQETDGVLQRICEAVSDPHPRPLPPGRRS